MKILSTYKKYILLPKYVMFTYTYYIIIKLLYFFMWLVFRLVIWIASFNKTLLTYMNIGHYKNDKYWTHWKDAWKEFQIFVYTKHVSYNSSDYMLYYIILKYYSTMKRW